MAKLHDRLDARTRRRSDQNASGNSGAWAVAIADIELHIVSNGISLSDGLRLGGVLQR
ncbi:hypothetical protein [Bradyrhizobium elkanii]|uniref:hypothetical protein n=1 Tax=Bradyrhizobium elkanii TaxID=29448 RepID=UPI001BA8383F|nr:hypothetical protein [Bradyrhizobium elkanii]MBR1158899.1 hypothetical protein [Bradyrhizobium elkanii]